MAIYSLLPTQLPAITWRWYSAGSDNIVSTAPLGLLCVNIRWPIYIFIIKQNICITFIQCWTNVEDVGPTLYKCYTNALYLLGSHTSRQTNQNVCDTKRQARFLLMLGQSLRRCPTFNQHWVNVCCLLVCLSWRWELTIDYGHIIHIYGSSY